MLTISQAIQPRMIGWQGIINCKILGPEWSQSNSRRSPAFPWSDWGKHIKCIHALRIRGKYVCRHVIIPGLLHCPDLLRWAAWHNRNAGTCSVRISARTSAIMTEFSSGFLQSLQANTGMLLQEISFQILFNSLFICHQIIWGYVV
jgi:hypothetical protein